MKRKTQKTISVFITLLLVLLLPVQAFAGEYNIANGDITVTVNGSGEQHISYFDEYNAKQEVDNDDNPVITGFSTDNIVTITVAAGQTANVTLKDLQIAHSSSTNEAAVSTSGDGDVNIELDGDNWLMSGNTHAGLEKNNAGTLTIGDDSGAPGRLTAIGGEDGAGIGGGDSGNGSNITITGGEIKAIGGQSASGIGGGKDGDGNNITISGGTVEASGGIDGGAGGWCASGFMNAWKEATEAPVHEVKAEASAVIPPTQGENEEKPMSASEIANLVDKLAHFSTFGMDRSEEEKMGAELLKCGDKALKAIVNYLILCASGRQRDYWWSNASYLVKMIKEFPGADLEQIYNALINQNTNIWEYHTQIKEVAEQELLNYKKSSPDYDKFVIPDVDARAELNALFNSGGSVESRLEKAIAMRVSSEAWSNENKAYYYYILGYYVQYLSTDDTKALPFYAAQVFYRPDRTTAGWDKIQSISAFKDVSRTVETAELFHEMYPIPENWDYLLKLN